MSMVKISGRKRISWLIALMTLSLLGISGIQAYWITNAYNIKEEKFDQEVAEALSHVSQRLETLESVNFLFESFEIKPFFSSRVNPFIELKGGNDSSLIVMRKQQKSKFNFSMQIDGDTVVKLLSDPRGSSVQTYIKKKKRLNGTVLERKENIVYQDGSDLIAKKAEQLDGILQKMILHEVRSQVNIEKRLSEENLDSILDFELKQKGINIPFEFVVLDNDVPILSSENWTSSGEKHIATLFPNDFFSNRLLMVSFPGKANYLLSSLWLTLFASILLTSAMGYTFYRTVNYFLRQKRISEIKTDFINNMTHEFKTPIATINLAIDALKNPKVISDQSKIQHYSEVIRQENQRMNMQVESVLRMALMEKKELELNMEKEDVRGLIEEAISHIRLNLESKGGRLQTFYNDQRSQLWMDKNHFINTIINILDNAIKYSNGAPEVKIVTETSTDYFIIVISDKGVGMSKEEQKHIFDRFYRVSSGNIHNIKGHGLGLSYAKGIIEAHKGRIEVESEKGMGSKFYIYLPIEKL